MHSYHSFAELIGNTPLVRLANIEKEYQLENKLYAKIEMMNPTGSVKARIARFMIEEAIKDNKINANTIIIEPTSGNTGVGLAAICAMHQLQFIAVMPETVSIERRKLIQAYGGKVVLTSATLGIKGSVDKVSEMVQTMDNYFIPSQFDNMNNPRVHYLTTGPEIYKQTEGLIDIFVAGVGTGGTITGVSRYIKEKKTIQSVAVEPLSSPLLSKGIAGSHKIQGMGPNFIPNTVDLSVVDEIISVSDENAFLYAKMIAKKEGLFVGISSGAALYAALQIAQRNENKGKHIVVVLPDTGERYLSIEGFVE